MAKDKTPSNINRIGDSTRTEKTPEEIVEKGSGESFKKPCETNVEMHERRKGRDNFRNGGEGFEQLVDRQEKESNPVEESKPSINQNPSVRAIEAKLKERNIQPDKPLKEKEKEKDQAKKKDKDISHGF